MRSRRITHRQAEVVLALRNHHHLYGYMPSVRELCVILNKGRGTIVQHLQSLHRKKVIRITPNKARAIEILTAA